MDLTRYQNYLLYQIANAQIRNWPWPHVVFTELFHADQYASILDNLPSIDLLEEIQENKPHPGRFTYPTKNYSDFWINLQNQFIDGRLKQLLLDKFYTQLNHRLGQYINSTEFYDTFQLTRDTAGYSLIPHTDVFSKIFTIVINLPHTSENLNMGTAIYTGPKDKHILYQSDFAPNTGFGVFKTNNSWHGVEPIEADRWTIQYTVWGRDK
jgi:hypothetical protein